ncbi:MAG: tRNA pseudouridine synthase A [Nitrososphaerota archaeon]
MTELKPPWIRSRGLEVRIEAETDSNYGYDPAARPIAIHLRYGVINLDKHRGPTSHEIAATVKKILGLQRVGHGGTLETLGEIPLSPAFYP